MHRKSGDNPHLWYDPATMPAVARSLASAFAAADPAHKDDYAARLATFLAALAPLDAKIAAIRDKYAGTVVTATEPVFGDMAEALKLSMANERFQLAIMNDTEPSARDVAAFERDLKDRKVRVLFYNKQARPSLSSILSSWRAPPRFRSSASPRRRPRAVVPGLDAQRARRNRSARSAGPSS